MSALRKLRLASSSSHGRTEIGRGLSAVVYREIDPDVGTALAIKLFTGHWKADAVHLVFNGAANPYSWCEDAAMCALYRRRILAQLVPTWFDGALHVADAHEIAFNYEHRAWELVTNYVQGYPVALHHPFSGPRESEQRELRDLCARLQQNLMESGFVGLTWQAGLSNPVAANNFLVTDRRRDGRGGAPTWHWIDLESGVPALFPINPLRLLTHYARWSFRLRRPLFDDVLTGTLEEYLRGHAERIDAARGPGTTRRLRQWARALDEHQRAWHARGRLERSVEAALARAEIDPAAARDFERHPTRWFSYQFRRAAGLVRGKLAERARRLRARIRALDVPSACRLTLRLASSVKARRRAARAYAIRRARAWQERGQLSRREVGYLARLAAHTGHAPYLADFLVHLGLKPFYKPVAWLLLPLLVQAGVLSLPWAATLLMLSGSIARTLYTGYRCAGELAAGRPAPWIALLVGTAPVVGSAAFPVQLLASSTSRDGRLAAFLLYDLLGAVGRSLPIWGGEDTGTEHFFNRLADAIVRSRGPLLARSS